MNADFTNRRGPSQARANAPPAGTALGFRRAFGRHWRDSVRYYGLRHTATQVAEATYRFFREFLPGRRRAKYGDLDYDFDHDVDTTRANVGFREQLIAALSGHQYFPTEPWLFDEIMQALTAALSPQHSAVSIQPSAISAQPSAVSVQPLAAGQEAAPAGLHDFTFVDLGSGKGRVLLMAATYGFRKIIGVEFMPEWHRMAEENIRKYAERQAGATETLKDEGTDKSVCATKATLKDEGADKRACATKAANIESLCMDARDFSFPAGPLVVYLFNPFPEPVLAAVLDHLRKSLLDDPRAVFIAYRFPEFDSLLKKCGWLEKTAGTEQWTVWRNRRDRA